MADHNKKRKADSETTVTTTSNNSDKTKNQNFNSKKITNQKTKNNNNNNSKNNNKKNNNSKNNNNSSSDSKHSNKKFDKKTNKNHLKKKQKVDHTSAASTTTTTTTTLPTITPLVSHVVEEQQPLPVILPESINRNWDLISKSITSKPKKQPTKAAASSTSTTTSTTTTSSSTEQQPIKTVFELVQNDTNKEIKVTKVLAVDCEMVEVEGRKSALGSVCLVNSEGQTVYKSYVKPMEKITDYRTPWSGLTFKLLSKAPEFLKVQKDVSQLIKDKILVGHDIKQDLGALMLNHPPQLHKKQWEKHVRNVFYPKKKTTEQRKEDREKKQQDSQSQNIGVDEDQDE
ncbi:hypothetical protein PPL_07097 [Heterostelium album PN500]|uniref:Exonuclease domain-containing protein n=1 Tax=Heterostelium pallidum (strain ATCC 26659 / Pp 5 / PN500) TaxID=670386 RepID=D3BED9_HETP5|nr:hypothetical protein PPL_07097 [Heterostelium album PN500]EFA80270.1 hypothetical protein PPL_07097 [Heterostelium album PN500]|eukprot:XP_020432390.1 hypothetical protein PPL_07097 [Heterostelium album PN500]